jgi:hypothetical protein
MFDILLGGRQVVCIFIQEFFDCLVDFEKSNREIDFIRIKTNYMI